MSIVAFCSMLIGVSAILATVIVPFLAMALVRTLRTRRPLADEAIERRRRGLMTTFCASLVLIVTLLAVSAATAVFALATATLIALDFAARGCRPVFARLQPVLKQAWRMTRVAFRHLASLGSYSNIQRALDWSSATALLGTRYLVAATGILHRRYWRLDLRELE
ncbi:MAG TPA: hypothetical protein VJ828_17040 [Lacipirellulaceae bacterium]|nr:hypothetical protein [Lacipirellulaceae bacterium]